MTGQEGGAPGAAEGRPLLHTHLGPHQTEAAHPALHLRDQPPVYRVARHGLVMAKPETEICLFSIGFIWDEMAKCRGCIG